MNSRLKTPRFSFVEILPRRSAALRRWWMTESDFQRSIWASNPQISFDSCNLRIALISQKPENWLISYIAYGVSNEPSDTPIGPWRQYENWRLSIDWPWSNKKQVYMHYTPVFPHFCKWQILQSSAHSHMESYPEGYETKVFCSVVELIAEMLFTH